MAKEAPFASLPVGALRMPRTAKAAVGTHHSPVSPKDVVAAGRASLVADDAGSACVPDEFRAVDVPELPDDRGRGDRHRDRQGTDHDCSSEHLSPRLCAILP